LFVAALVLFFFAVSLCLFKTYRRRLVSPKWAAIRRQKQHLRLLKRKIFYFLRSNGLEGIIVVGKKVYRFIPAFNVPNHIDPFAVLHPMDGDMQEVEVTDEMLANLSKLEAMRQEARVVEAEIDAMRTMPEESFA
jgi:hypothetical protein